MEKYIPDTCPIRKSLDPDYSDYTEEACFGCEYQCIASAMARLQRAVAEAERAMLNCIIEKVNDLEERYGPFFQNFQFPFPAPETIKRRENHVRTWKRRDPRNGKSKEDR